MARGDLILDAPAGQFDHYDEYGRPVDVNGQIMAAGLGGDVLIPHDQEPPPTSAAAPPPATDTGPGPAPGPVQPPPSGGGGGGASPPGDNPFGLWSGRFTPPTAQPLPGLPLWDPAQAVPGAPTFTPPTYVPPPAFDYGPFVGPTAAEAIDSPGYQFRLNQGTDRLQNAASARGTLNDSGTLKALIDYGQDAASQEYANVWKRDYDQYATNRANAVDRYNINYRTQYQDPYMASYQAAKDQFAPQMTQYEALLASGRDLNQAKLLGYSTEAANVQHLNDLQNTNAWNDYLLGWQDYEARRNTAANFALQS
jgi:hypothetical protein